MPHLCHAHKCTKVIPPKLFMCARHWNMLPSEFRNDIWKHYVPGQEIRKSPTREYVKATQRAKAYVLLRENGAKSPEEVVAILKKISRDIDKEAEDNT